MVIADISICGSEIYFAIRIYVYDCLPALRPIGFHISGQHSYCRAAAWEIMRDCFASCYDERDRGVASSYDSRT